MSSFTRALFLGGVVVCVGIVRPAVGQEAVMEEIRVEASFTSSLELPSDRAVDLLTRRLLEREDANREFELRLANRGALTTLLDLTRVIPIPLGGSENRIDTFLLQNYMRADLNPPKRSALFDSK